MMRRSLLALVALFVAATPSFATGINLSWDDCGGGGVAMRDWACDAESGTPFVLVASFIAPAGIQELLAVSAQVDLTVSKQLPDWWKHGVSLCRGSSALTPSFDATGVAACTDYMAGAWVGGIAYDFPSVQRARLRLTAIGPAETYAALTEGTEYFAFALRVARGPTATCAGCALDACIVLNSIQLYQTPQQNLDPDLQQAPVGGRNHVSWQSAKIVNCPQGTATRNATWGAVKSLYR